MAGITLIAAAQHTSPEGTVSSPFCLETPSYQLFLQINDFRQDEHLPGIPLSGSLCYVAAMHARDLVFNKPTTGECGFHSWSAKGRWTPCCFSAEEPAYSCMWNKPRELTRYKARGYEIIYWQNDAIEPEDAITAWKRQSLFHDMILNKGPWDKKTWKALGVCVFEGFAILWLGEETDWEGEPDLCDERAFLRPDAQVSDSISVLPSYMTELRYYLVVASLPNMEKATGLLKDYQQKGFTAARIITFDNRIRISLNDYPTYHEAKKAKANLGSEYQQVWILEQ